MSVVLWVGGDWNSFSLQLTLDSSETLITEQEQLAYLDPCCRPLRSYLPYAPDLQEKKKQPTPPPKKNWTQGKPNS